MQDLIVLSFMALLSRQLDFFPFFFFLFFFFPSSYRLFTQSILRLFSGYGSDSKVVKHWASFELESLKEWVVSFILMQVEI